MNGVENDFFIDNSHFSYSLWKSEDKSVRGEVEISNPNDLEISVIASDKLLIETDDRGGIILVTFNSLSANELSLGLNRESILVKSNGIEKRISIDINVVEFLSFPKKNVYFCLDGDELIVRQSTPKAKFVRITLGIEDKNEFSLSYMHIHDYEYVFFDKKLSLFIGEDVQDFLREMVDVVNVANTESVNLKYTSKAANVVIIINEYDEIGNTYKSHKLLNLKFLPGRRPKAYPFLTNAVLRSTLSSSLISVSALCLDFKAKSLGMLSGTNVDVSGLDDYSVCNICFRRSFANKVYGDKNVIEKDGLSLEPRSPLYDEPGIDVIFQNQNYCPDWFTFSSEWEQESEFENVISNNTENGKEFKVLTKEKKTLKLNSGWIFEEEISLLHELIKSRVCFIDIGKKWIKAIAVSKKPLKFDSERSLNSQIVEFKIIEDER